jgi:hypothetical protein
MGNEKYMTKFQLKFLKGRDHVGDLDVDGGNGLIKGYRNVIGQSRKREYKHGDPSR